MRAKSVLTITAGLTAMALGLTSHGVIAKTLKVTTCLVKNDSQSEVYLDYFHNKVNAAGGGVKLKYIGGPEVTPRRKQGAALKRGLVDIIFCPGAYYGGMVPEARTLGASNVSPQELRKNGAYDILQKGFAKGLNAKILGWAFWGGTEFHIYTAFTPIKSDKTGIDLSGKKMRSGGLYNAMFKALKAVPVSISPTEVYTALERGVVQGIAYPIGAITKYGWEKFIKYRITPAFYRSSSMVMINLDSFNGLPKSDQDILLRIGLSFENERGKALREKVAEDTIKLKAAGVKDLKLEGAQAKAYLDTIYSVKWKANAKYKYQVPFEELKAKMYKPR